MRIPVIAALTALFLGCSNGSERAETGAGAADLAAAEGSASSVQPGDVTPSDTAPWMVERPEGLTSPAQDSGWTADRRSGGDDETHARMLAVRTAPHAEYDRVVFEFDSAVPGYTIEYVDSPQHQCGSGHEVRLPGDAWLEIHFTPAAAHDEGGHPTIENRQFDPEPANLRQLRLICDFEGHVEWILGVDSPNPFRVLVLTDPARLVVDLRK